MLKIAVTFSTALALFTVSGHGQSLTVRGSVSMATRDAVDIVGNYAYAVGQNSFAVINMSNPQSPTIAGQTSPGVANIASVDVESGYAYCAGMATGLVVIDVTNPSSPSWVTNRVVQGQAYHVAVYDTLVAVATNSNVSLFGISNPENPNLLTSYGRAATWIVFDGLRNELHCGSSTGAFLLEVDHNGNDFNLNLLDQFGGDQNSPAALQGDFINYVHLNELRAVQNSTYTLSGQYNASATIRAIAPAPELLFIGLQSGLVQVLTQTGDDPVFAHGVTLPAQVNGLAVNTSTHLVAAAHNSGLTLISYSALDADEQPHPELPNTFSISAYPNPFNSTAHLNLSTLHPGDFQLTIYDLLGRVTYSEKINLSGESVRSISFMNLSAGLYIARLSGMSSSVATRLLYLP